jgi:hypothetical protein
MDDRANRVPARKRSADGAHRRRNITLRAAALALLLAVPTLGNRGRPSAPAAYPSAADACIAAVVRSFDGRRPVTAALAVLRLKSARASGSSSAARGERRPAAMVVT